MLSYRLHPSADLEAMEAAAYMQLDDPSEAELFKLALEEALEWARQEPMIFRCFEADFRKVKVGKFSYTLVFRVRENEIQILAVVHMSRLPGYWKERSEGWV